MTAFRFDPIQIFVRPVELKEGTYFMAVLALPSNVAMEGPLSRSRQRAVAYALQLFAERCIETAPFIGEAGP